MSAKRPQARHRQPELPLAYRRAGMGAGTAPDRPSISQVPRAAALMRIAATGRGRTGAECGEAARACVESDDARGLLAPRA